MCWMGTSCSQWYPLFLGQSSQRTQTCTKNFASCRGLFSLTQDVSHLPRALSAPRLHLAPLGFHLPPAEIEHNFHHVSPFRHLANASFSPPFRGHLFPPPSRRLICLSSANRKSPCMLSPSILQALRLLRRSPPLTRSLSVFYRQVSELTLAWKVLLWEGWWWGEGFWRKGG